MTAFAGGIRRVQLCRPAAATILREASESRDGRETGGILLGHVRADGTVEVRCAGGPGPVAVRQPRFFLRDLDHAWCIAEEAFARDGSTWIGEWHTHPTTAPMPSDRDLYTYVRLLADPDLHFEVVLSIIVVGQGDWSDPVACAWACYPNRAEGVPLVVDRPCAVAGTPLMEENP
ncbi:Mov34/MPN/PAD-1 family protein [Nonomuraea sp. NPDC049625]|uniref:Mov34/MPN/PAD-1 family protein n=1 Tax=Nonomuraea sp. NPDC049625 TaxID=3155775 RepID=UPI003449E85E